MSAAERFGMGARVTHAGGSGDINHICGTVIAVEDEKRQAERVAKL